MMQPAWPIEPRILTSQYTLSPRDWCNSDLTTSRNSTAQMLSEIKPITVRKETKTARARIKGSGKYSSLWVIMLRRLYVRWFCTNSLRSSGSGSYSTRPHSRWRVISMIFHPDVKVILQIATKMAYSGMKGLSTSCSSVNARTIISKKNIRRPRSEGTHRDLAMYPRKQKRIAVLDPKYSLMSSIGCLLVQFNTHTFLSHSSFLSW
mmetsp:Transcript_409/g.1045  ORF Transcript_409/g.1045 Transcript_409/m.1045 type:complete len:206 (+) Transcript_409:1113-1730(+)